MKKIISILLIAFFLFSCAVPKQNTLSALSTAASCVPTPTPNPACNPTTPTPSPTITPTVTTPPMAKFDPYSLDNKPLFPAIYEVAPMNEYGFDKLSVYTVARLPNNYFPATMWVRRWDGLSSLTWTYCPANIMNVGLKKLNSDWAFNYLNSLPDGERFSSGFREGIVYPSTPKQKNVVHVIGAKYRQLAGLPSQWYFYVDTYPCTATAMLNLDPATTSTYYLQHQSDMTYNGALIDGKSLMGQDAIMILTNTIPVTNTTSHMVIQASQLLNVQVAP